MCVCLFCKRDLQIWASFACVCIYIHTPLISGLLCDLNMWASSVCMCVYVYIYEYIRTHHGHPILGLLCRLFCKGYLHIILDEYCSTVQGLLDWCEVDLGFTELLFIQIDLCCLFCKGYLHMWASFVHMWASFVHMWASFVAKETTQQT